MVGLARELKEELGVTAKIGHAVFVDVWFSPKGTARYFVAFSCKLENKSTPFVLQKEEIAEFKWIGKEELDRLPLYEICRNALKAYFAKR
jgi:8-oxo-dGTP pyrophosphatase MutT (NUDIX family)